MDVQALKKNRVIDYDKIAQSFKQNERGEAKSYNDDRFWKLDRDKVGNGSAIIRFLPKVMGDSSPFAIQYDHAFQGPKGLWYIEKSLTTIKHNDPLYELNDRLWKSGLDSDKEIARKQKRRLSYICNILVISDPKHPENNGQVKLFKIGKKIYDMIENKLSPTFEDVPKVKVWDLFEGANFRIRINQVDGWPSYGQSEFDAPSEIFNGDGSIWAKEMVETPDPEDMYLKRQYPLSEFFDAKNFKSYEELSRRLAEVLNTVGVEKTTASALSSAPAPTIKSTPAPTAKSLAIDDDDDDDVMNYFKKIVESD